MVHQLEIKKSKREQIIEEAILLFKEKGYSATTVRDIADKVGMEAASLYNHIKSKDDILKTICFDIANTYRAHLEEVTSMKATPMEKIKTLMRLQISIITSNPASSLISNFEWKHLPDFERNIFISERKHYETVFKSLIEMAIAKGEMKAVNSSIALYTILASVRWIDIWYKSERNISPETLEETISSIMLSGLEK